ncbi:MAG TPA: hypothetical protein VEF76_02165 [Patescibacteria group bacterium]|nr:hypothetical protein [Patescibacteria group bacterium]
MSPARSSSTSSSERRPLRRFYLGLIAPLLLCALYFSFATALLLRSGEYLPLDTIIARQNETGGVYGSAVMMRGFYYKQHLYKLRRPEILSLGSSRVLGFRQQDFSKPFANMGSLSDIEEVIEAAETAFRDRAPQVVIFGIDFWWFHPQAENRAINRSPEDGGIGANDLFQPFNWLVSGRVTPAQALQILKGDTKDIGIAGITQQDGTDAAGAHYYTSTVTGAKPPEDFQFRFNLAKVEKGEKKYAHGAQLSETQWKKLLGLLDFLQRKKIHVVMFMPPMAPRVAQAMVKTGGYAYVDSLRQRLAALAAERRLPWFDYHDGGPTGTTDCEFVDAHHGGNVVYQRMLLDMAIRDDRLRGYLNLAQIGWNIEHFGGQSSLRDDEVDFLGLNCTKPSVQKRL